MPHTRQIGSVLNNDLSQFERLPQPVFAYGRELSAGENLPFHKHQRAQLVYASRGVMAVMTRSVSFVVPPQRAVWMPGQEEHRIEARSDIAMRTLYIEPEVLSEIPREPCILQVTPLLRELIVDAVTTGPEYEPDSPQSRIIAVILDKIAALPVISLSLPMPQDSRMLRITQELLENPGDKRSLEEWSTEVGASKRTLNRLFSTQTGMTFNAWRQQRRLLRAIELLACGESVTATAMEVGYENTSAFIGMFKRCLGTTPSKYLSHQQ